jgi:hypothetical protein
MYLGCSNCVKMLLRDLIKSRFPQKMWNKRLQGITVTSPSDRIAQQLSRQQFIVSLQGNVTRCDCSNQKTTGIEIVEHPHIPCILYGYLGLGIYLLEKFK